MRFYFFHLMPYSGLPADSGPAWVVCPNRHYDPTLGAQLYTRYIDELIAAEKLGFDGIVINEHHSTPYGSMPSPNLIAAALARQTTSIRIAVIGNALPLYNPPTRVAEELAMIDVLSGGRLIAGMVVGGGPEYFTSSVNPVFAREKFREAHDLVIKAWTTNEPFSFNGKHYRLRHVNVWPRPLQQPHPPIWIPGIGSLETMDFVAERRYSYMGIPYFHPSIVKRNMELFREACDRRGYTASPLQTGWLCPVFVGESDASAEREFAKHFKYFVERLLPGINIPTPGYTSAKSIKNVVSNFSRFITEARSLGDAIDGEFVLVGSPSTVRDRLARLLSDLKVGNFLGMFQLGTLPHAATLQSLELFARDVMPRLKAIDTASIPASYGEVTHA